MSTLNLKLSNKKHGGTGTHTYAAWQAMRSRAKKRGEFVVPRWSDYARFRDDMGKRPLGARLERLDSTAPWCKLNCYWVLPLETK